MLSRRTVLATGALAAVPLSTPLSTLAQGRKNAVVLAMTLEPTGGMDPTASAASSIARKPSNTCGQRLRATPVHVSTAGSAA